MDPSIADSPISRRELVGSTSNMPVISTRQSSSRTIIMTFKEQQQQQKVEETTNEVLILTLQPRRTVTIYFLNVSFHSFIYVALYVFLNCCYYELEFYSSYLSKINK